MLKYFFSNRLLIGALAVFICCVGGSLLYMQHVKQVSEKELALTQERVQQWNERQEQQPPAAATSYKRMPQQSAPTSEGTAQPTRGSKEGPSRTYETPEEHVESIFTEITAEEQQAEETLSAEELRNKEGRERLKNVFSKIRNLIASEGGKIDHTSSLSARVEFFHHQQELFRLFEEGADEIPAGLRFFMNLSMRMGNATNAAGEFPVSEYVNIADYMEAEGDVETATRMRAVAQSALGNGDDIIKSEHFKVDR